MSKEEIIAAIQECARKLGRAPRFAELEQHCPAAKMGAIRKYIGTYTLALRESGVECVGAGFEIAMDDLFRDWTRVARKLRKVPNMTEYEHESKYSVRPLMGRFKRWTQMPRGMHEYARQRSMEAEYADVLEIDPRVLQGRTGVSMDVRKEGRRKGVRGVWSGRTVRCMGRR
jgi:hypothetical protein